MQKNPFGSMKEFSGRLTARYLVHLSIVAMLIPTIILSLFALAGLGGLGWMVAGMWTFLICWFVLLAVYDPAPSKEITKLKLYCIVSKEALAKMTIEKPGKPDVVRMGKFAAQCGHAFLHAWWDALDRFPTAALAYQASDHAFKITLVVETDDELRALEASYKDVCGVSLVTDAGFTVFTEPTVTCLGIGPIRPEDVKKDLSGLRLLQ